CSFSSFLALSTSQIYTRSLHDALPILPCNGWMRETTLIRLSSPGAAVLSRIYGRSMTNVSRGPCVLPVIRSSVALGMKRISPLRSEEHTSELQSRENLVCRLLLENKKK